MLDGRAEQVGEPAARRGERWAERGEGPGGRGCPEGRGDPRAPTQSKDTPYNIGRLMKLDAPIHIYLCTKKFIHAETKKLMHVKSDACNRRTNNPNTLSQNIARI